jgi:tight adherence protein B
MVILVLTFVIVFALIAGGSWAIARTRSARRSSWKARLGGQDWAAQPKPESNLLRTPRASSLHHFNRWLLRRPNKLITKLQASIDRAGVQLTPGAIILACCFSALFFNVLLTYAPVVVQALGTALGLTPPLAYLRYRTLRRDRRFEELFPEGVEVIARALRAGHSFTTAVAIAAEEVAEPLASELKLLYDWQTYGRPFDEAMRDFADRAPMLDARFFATAVLTQRETGGNLSEILDNLAAVIRERFAVRRQVRALTAQGRLSGWILAAAPPVLAALLFLVNPDHLRSFVADPLGMQMVTAAALLQLVGMVLIRRIVSVDY